MRSPEFWIALPDSFLADFPTLREKTVKIGVVARTAAIFRVTCIHLYHHASKAHPGDPKLIKEILEFLDTPQYLRKHLYGMKEELSYAGLLPPLRTPPHTVPSRKEDVGKGDHREGVVVSTPSGRTVDVGLQEPAYLRGVAKEGQRVAVRITSTSPRLECELSGRDRIGTYWGFRVFSHRSLGKLLSHVRADATVLTSRRGEDILSNWQHVLGRLSSASKILVVFGSTKEGVFEILSDEGISPRSAAGMVVNLFPGQGTATIRLEEALLGSLAILNVAARLEKA